MIIVRIQVSISVGVEFVVCVQVVVAIVVRVVIRIPRLLIVARINLVRRSFVKLIVRIRKGVVVSVVWVE